MRIIDPRRSMMIILRHQTRKNFLPPDALFYTCSIASKRRLEISRACVCVCRMTIWSAVKLIMLIRTQFFVVENVHQKTKLFSGKFSKPGQKFFLLTSYSAVEPSPLRLLTGCTWMTWRIADQIKMLEKQTNLIRDGLLFKNFNLFRLEIRSATQATRNEDNWSTAEHDDNFLWLKTPNEKNSHLSSSWCVILHLQHCLEEKTRGNFTRVVVCVCRMTIWSAVKLIMLIRTQFFVVENVHQKTKLFSGKFSKPGQKFFLLTSYSNPLPLDSWQVAHEWHGGSRISWFAFKEF